MNKKEFLTKLGELWDKYPEQRFGQLLFNYTRFGTRDEPGTIKDIFWYLDEAIKSDIERSLEEEG